MIGLVGLGNMGYAIYQALCDNYQIYVYDPYVKEKYPQIHFADQITELEKSNIIILAVKPNKISEVVKQFELPHTFISIAAGVKIATIKEVAKPKSIIIRLMPNLPLLAREGAIGMYGDVQG
ncbi:MAG: NAD(P)-binding domain-containing protein, partial [Leptospiraceae bacterium]|nr:NAD(P)-binding domain-containing protein [Leptospiraceae bacterium]